MEGTKNKGIATIAVLLLALLVMPSLLTSTANASDACCDTCICTKSIPPFCSCADVKSSCSPTCNSCVCTKSIPPQCRCTDNDKDHCDPPCSSTLRIQEVVSS